MKFTTHFDLHSQASRLSSNNSPRAYIMPCVLVTGGTPRALLGEIEWRREIARELVKVVLTVNVKFTGLSTRNKSKSYLGSSASSAMACITKEDS